jgi:hypothetical protein
MVTHHAKKNIICLMCLTNLYIENYIIIRVCNEEKHLAIRHARKLTFLNR